MCRAYGQRPSQVLEFQDPEAALDFDLAIYGVHKAERDSQITSAAEQSDVWVGVLTALQLGA